MRWRKLGLVFCPDGARPWARTHAFVPTPWIRADGTIRVFAAFLDADRMGRVGYVDVDAADPRRILAVSERPVLDLGEPAAFDESGVTPMSIVEVDGRLRLYYTGWQRAREGRYLLLTGVAESCDGGESFRRISAVPVMERSESETCFRTAAWVTYENGRWRAWYVAGSRWFLWRDRWTPTYDLRHMESKDGLTWPAAGDLCLAPEEPDEYGFGRPWVGRGAQGYRALYSIRSRSRGYRLGHAVSPDGLTWRREDHEAGLDVSADGWDSSMVCFGVPVETPSASFLFYNGNDYGRTGFGVAVLEDAD